MRRSQSLGCLSYSSSLRQVSLAAFVRSSYYSLRSNAHTPFSSSSISLSSLPFAASAEARTFPNNLSQRLPKQDVDIITVEDALRGSQQAYYAVGSVIKVLIDGLLSPPVVDTPLPEDGAKVSLTPPGKKGTVLEKIGIMRELLTENYPERHLSTPFSLQSNSSSLDEDATSTPSTSSKELEKLIHQMVSQVGDEKLSKEVMQEIHHTVKQLQRILPLSNSFACNLVGGVIHHTALTISCSNDYILGSSCVKAVVSANRAASTADEEKLQTFVLCQSKPLRSEELNSRTKCTPLIPKNDLNKMRGEKSSEDDASAEVDFTVRSFSVRHAVVTPPQRYLPMYSWFYDRLTGYSNSNERTVVAKFIAQTSNFNLFRGFDFLVRLFTSKPGKLPIAPFLQNISGLTNEVCNNGVPIVYKDMRFSRNNDCDEWLLDSIETHQCTDWGAMPES